MRTLLFTLCLLTPTAAFAGEAKARLVADASLLEDQLANTRWTMDLRDEKKRLEREVQLQHRIINAVATVERALVGCGTSGQVATRGGGVQVVLQRELSDVEVELIARILRIEDRLERDDWRIDNRDERKALEKERERLQKTLTRVALSLCGDGGALVYSNP
jgi:hypothetical protein